ncbi:uncharacterized protein TNCV_3694561 [Trichonephila clavipes]|nr:uncharacterized protein TNCV_3694561 [Trichonephila clavipes]
MQNSTPSRIVTEVTRFLRKKFTDELVLNPHFTHLWPPNLTPIDFWLWGYVESQVYCSSPASIVELKDAIYHEFSCIQPEMSHAAVNGIITRM